MLNEQRTGRDNQIGAHRVNHFYCTGLSEFNQTTAKCKYMQQAVALYLPSKSGDLLTPRALKSTAYNKHTDSPKFKFSLLRKNA